MKKEPIIAVVGLARCGTSLLMRMLHKAGLEYVADNELSYEDDRAAIGRQDFSWLKECGGKCVKLLEPQILPLPRDLDYRFLWCERNPVEQARSQLKILKHWAGFHIENYREELHRTASGIRSDNEAVPEALLKTHHGSRLMRVAFEKLLESPELTLALISRFLEQPLNATACIEVKRRDARCYPGFLEDQLEKERGAAA